MIVWLLSPISVWCCVCALASGAVVCPKDMPYGLPALQLLRFAASPLVAFHMHVCVWHTGRGVNKEGFGGLVVFLRFRFEALVAFRFVEVP